MWRPYVLAAPGDTWGIAGPDFVEGYLVALVVFLLAAIAFRYVAARSDPVEAPSPPGPAELAVVAGGPSQAVYASLAGLRAIGLVALGPRGTLAVTDVVPPDSLSRLDRAVYEAATREVATARLLDDQRVRAALADVVDTVARSGWLYSDTGRYRARIGAWLLFALAALGLVRIIAGLANGRPVGFLALLTIAAGVSGGWLVLIPRLSAAGRRLLSTQQRQHAHLHPRQAPSWPTYGQAGAAMGVALFGTAALWASDPTFAADAGIRRTATDSYGGNSGGGGGG